ncbi:MAG: response regulator [Planctomycetota bacterium]
MSGLEPEPPLLCIVEDDSGLAKLELLELKRRGYRVEVFDSASAVLAFPRVHEVACWLVDQGLAVGQTGLQLVAELQRRGIQAPVVLVTGNDDPNVLLTALRAGVKDYVRKGAGFLELLVSRVDAVLTAWHTERELQRSQARLEIEAERRRELEAEISERRHAEERAHAALARLRDIDRRKDEFLAMLGHELRNPLAPIASAVEVLRTAPDDEQRVAWAAGVIGRQVDQMRRLVDDLLDVARIMNGRLTLRRELIDLRDVVQQAVERASPLLLAHAHEFVQHIAAEPLFVDGDPVRLVQIVANLLDNAAKYTPPNGRIDLHLQRLGTTAELRIVDNGAGMPREVLDVLFGLFVQGERAPDRSEGGLGLGLALVRRLVSLHRGSVTAESEGPNRGSTFTVRLPLTTLRPAAPNGTEAESRGDQRRALVVDDNVDAATATAMLLQLWGFEVTTAADGEQALTALQRCDPDAVLLDIGLPRLDGYGVLAAAGELPNARRRLWIAVTGYGQASDRERALAAGFDVHLTKPVAPDGLRQALAPVMSKPARPS